MSTALKVILGFLGYAMLMLFVYACCKAAKDEDYYYCLWDDIEHCDDPCNLNDYFDGGKHDV